MSQRIPPQNITFALTNKILVNVSGESKQNIRLNMNKNMTTAEAMNLPIDPLFAIFLFQVFSEFRGVFALIHTVAVKYGPAVAVRKIYLFKTCRIGTGIMES